jgi:hypothetical protein
VTTRPLVGILEETADCLEFTTLVSTIPRINSPIKAGLLLSCTIAIYFFKG